MSSIFDTELEGKTMEQVSYQNSCDDQVGQVNPGEILLTLYDGAIHHVGQALEQIEAGDAVSKDISLNKAGAIISQFINSLDYDKAPELCTNLEQLYGFMIDQMVDANNNMNAKPLVPVLDHLSQLRDAWSQVV